MVNQLANIYRVHLAISPSEMEKFYRGQAAFVAATSVCGKRLRFPARNLRDFLTADGVHGVFEIATDQTQRLVYIRRV